MRASPNGVPSRRLAQMSPFLGCPGTVKSLLLEMYGPAVEATLLCGRQETLPEAHRTILASAGCPFVGVVGNGWEVTQGNVLFLTHPRRVLV